MTERPNVLWLTYEDTSPQFVSCYGMTPVPTTPTMDRLAAGGVRFDNAFASAPVCSASRSAIITGCSNAATGLGHHRSKYPLPTDRIRGFPAYLREAGYYTTNNVKTDYNIADEPAFIADAWNESSREAHWRKRPAGTPFFSVFNTLDSHQSRTMTRPWKWYEEFVLGALPPEEVVSPDDIAMPPIYRDNAEMRRHVSRVYNALKLCDRQIAARLEELREDGLMDETIIFCFADHGEGIPRGKSNGIGFGYRAAFVLWFPEKYAHLSPWGTQTVTDELVSFEDLAPTLLSLAGVPVPPHMTGRALLGDQRREPPPFIFAARDRIDDTPDLSRSAMDGRFVYTRNYYPHLPAVKYQKYADVGEILRAIRRDHAAGELDAVQAELVDPTRPAETLYDLSTDPWEIRNLAGSPDYDRELRRLREAVHEHSLAVHDVMFLPESEMIARAGSGTPYERRAEPAYNPLPELLDAAGLVGSGVAAIPQQLRLLEHADAAVRYWAAVGIFAARANVKPHAGALRRHLDDPAAFVQIELAAALYDATRDPGAKRVLERHIEGTHNLAAHQALEKVLYMPEAAADFADSVDRARAQRPDTGVNATDAFPIQEAIEMYLYLYRNKPLFYEGDQPYLN